MLQELIIKQTLPQVEGGKKALLVSGSPKRVSSALVGRLVELCDFVLAADSGAEILAAAKITPDLLLGDFDSIDQAVLARYLSQKVETETHDAYKDATDTELALIALNARGYTSVIAANVLGGRIDHELATLGCFAAEAATGKTVIIAEDDEICVFMAANNATKNLTFDFSTVVPTYISLVPWGSTAKVSIKGVEWELEHATLTPSSSLGISNESRKPQTHITVHDGIVMAIFQT
jgi:thiamine pyrophosphokinase